MGARALQFNLFRAERYFFVQNAISSYRPLFLCAERYFERISATPKTDARQGCCSCSGGRQ